MATILDMAVAMTLVFLAASLIVTATQELVASLFALRARNLAKGLRTLLLDNKTVLDLLKQPLVDSLAPPGKLPSYIPSKTFAQSVVSLLAAGKTGQAAADEVLAWARANKDKQRLAASIEALMVNAEQTLEALQAAVAGWYDGAMERVSGVYKRLVQKISIGIGFVIAVLLNLDAIRLFRLLLADEATRQALVDIGNRMSEMPDVQTAGDLFGKLGLTPGLADLDPMVLVGCLITALATSLGASFWFDILQRVVKVRAAGAAPADPPAQQ